METTSCPKGIAMARTLIMLIFAIAALWYVSYYGKSTLNSLPAVGVQGEGKTVAIPDVAEFNFSVVASGGKDIAALQKENTDKVNKAIEFVKSKGIEAKDIKTQNYLLEPRYQSYSCPSNEKGAPIPCPPSDVVGYSINQTVAVKVRNFTNLSDTLNGVIKNGANNVSDLRFTIDDRTQAENTARAEAMRKAREKAKAIAEAGGFQLGRLLNVDTWSQFPEPFYPGYGYNKGEVGGAPNGMGAGPGGPVNEVKEITATPIIAPGSQKIMVTVNLRYELK